MSWNRPGDPLPLKKDKIDKKTPITFGRLRNFFNGKAHENQLVEVLENLKENGSIYNVPGTNDHYDCF